SAPKTRVRTLSVTSVIMVAKYHLLKASATPVRWVKMRVWLCLALLGCTKENPLFLPGDLGVADLPGGLDLQSSTDLSCESEEICGDDVDNNCDGQVDEGCNGMGTFVAVEIGADTNP